MLADRCWVLLRPDMTWHVLEQHCCRGQGLFGQQTCCELTTPDDRLGIIAFTQAEPHVTDRVGIDHAQLCEPCRTALRFAHANRATPLTEVSNG